jgi:phosphoenolpyruvate carboxykinase (ATP)
MRQTLKPPKESTYYSDLPGFSLKNHGIHVAKIYRNASPAKLYEQAIKKEKGVAISSKGALIAFSGEKTGRSPKDKRVVDEETTKKDIWWGEVNIPLTEDLYYIQKTRAIDYLNTLEQLYVFDGFAGADKNYRIKVRVICYSAYHALFMHNMLIRPTCEEIANFGEPDFVIYVSHCLHH